MIASINSEKSHAKIQHPFMIRNLTKVSVEGTCINKIKATNGKPTANIIVNREELKAFPLRSGARQGRPLSPLPVHRVLGGLAAVVREEKQIKYIQIKKEEVKPLNFLTTGYFIGKTLQTPPKNS